MDEELNHFVDEIVMDWLEEAMFPPDDNGLSSSSSSLSEDDVPAVERHCITNYVVEVVPAYSEIEFKNHLRLRRQEVYDLIRRFENTQYLPENTGGPENISHERAFLLTVWYLANTETFRKCADRFNLSYSSTHKILDVILDYIVSLSEEYIVWPTTNEHLTRKISARFYDLRQINGVIGAVDGTYIRIRRPKNYEDDYVNRKVFHSVILQGTVDSEMLFTDVYIGEPGSLHDARVLRKSALYEKATEEPEFMAGYCLLGDSAYPNLPWLVPPYKNNRPLNDNQKLFNQRHSSTRVVVENAFGLLKQRFRRLKGFNNLRMDIIVRCIMSACILHNICILTSRNVDDNQEEDNIDPGVIDRRDYIFNEMFPDV